MGEIKGSRTVEIDASIEDVFEIAVDLDTTPQWQSSMRSVNVLERYEDGLAKIAEVESDAKVRTVRNRLRFSSERPHRIDWVLEKGDTKSTRGSWEFEKLDGGRTRATFSLAVDPGMVLGMLLRGPAQSKARDFLLGDAAEGLKRRAESGRR